MAVRTPRAERRALVAALAVAALAVPSAFAAGTADDRDGDGVVNAVDVDDDNDLVADVDEGDGDTDGDGVPNVFDVDADNDGVPDLYEALPDLALAARLDADGDGRLDGSVELGENGLADAVEPTPESGVSIGGRLDGDGDAVPDQLDLDSDNDGLVDLVEAGGADADGDGRVDRYRDLDADGRDDQLALFPILPDDTDADGTPDSRDLDSDGDGASDRLESSGEDVDSDGVVDRFADADGDGLDDRIAARPVEPRDSGGDARPDHLDAAIVGDESAVPTPGVDPGSGPGSDPDPEPDPDPDPDPGSDPIPVPGPDPDTTEPDPSADAIRPVVGRDGHPLGGCSIGGAGNGFAAFPPVLWLLAALALRRRRRVAAAVSAFAVALLAGCAGTASEPRAGVGLGASRLDPELDGTGLSSASRSDTSVLLFAGVALGPTLDAELRVADLGEVELDDGRAIGYRTLDVGVLAHRVVGRARPFLRAGVGTLLNDGVEVERRNAAHLLLGAGVDVALAPRWSLRLEASGHDADVVQGGIGLLHRFGGRPSRLPSEPLARAESDAVETRSEPAPEPPAERASDTLSGPEAEPPESLAERAPESPPEPDGSLAARAPEPLSAAEPEPLAERVPESPPEPDESLAESASASPPVSAPEPLAELDVEPLAEPMPAPADGSLVAPAATAGTTPVPDTAVRPLAGSGQTTAEASSGTDAPPESGEGLLVEPIDAAATAPARGAELLVDPFPGTPASASESTRERRADAPMPFDATGYDIRFAPGSERLSEESSATIELLARALADSPALELAIVARAAPGDAQADLLSRRRALVVVRALGEAGVDVSRLRPEISPGDGEERVDTVELISR